jgi:hypothetical protein
METLSLGRLWQGFHLLASQNSAYGNLAVLETDGSRTLLENGLVLFTVPDPQAAEESVHYALLQHGAPRSVLLIGGGLRLQAGEGSERHALASASLRVPDVLRHLGTRVSDLVGYKSVCTRRASRGQIWNRAPAVGNSTAGAFVLGTLFSARPVFGIKMGTAESRIINVVSI